MNTNHARTLRKNPTDAERRLWQNLKRRQIATMKFRRQQTIGPYIVDFVCFERRLIVEVDGGQHADQVSLDERRTCWLEAQGYRVLRFWNNDVLANVEAVAQANHYSERCTHLPPCGGRLGWGHLRCGRGGKYLTPHLGPPPQGWRKINDFTALWKKSAFPN